MNIDTLSICPQLVYAEYMLFVMNFVSQKKSKYLLNLSMVPRNMPLVPPLYFRTARNARFNYFGSIYALPGTSCPLKVEYK